MASNAWVAALRHTGPAVAGTAMAIVVPLALGLGGLFLFSSAEWIERMVCTYRLDAPCPGTATVLTVGGVVALIAAFGALATGTLLIRRRGHKRLFLPALTLIFATLAVLGLTQGSALGNAPLELAALASATGVASISFERSRLLTAALLAQSLDLATFGAVWQQGEGETNPLGRLIMQALGADPQRWDPDVWPVAAAAGLLLILAKLTLIGFLIRVTPYLGRYRRPVLVTAAVVGAIGAIANLLVIL